MYVGASLALDDARPGNSDLDLMPARPDGATNDRSMAALLLAVERTRVRYRVPWLDMLALGLADLAAGPDVIAEPRSVIFERQVALRDDASV